MGKSTVAELLRARGVPVVDTDDLARELVQPGQPALAEIKRVFGNAVVGADGSLLREKLAQIVFTDEVARARLESILHPVITSRWKEQVQAWRQEGGTACAVVIPLLFETNVEAHFDAVICVACSTTTQRQRLEKRSWTSRQIDQRNAAQWPIAKKLSHSHYVIWNEGEVDVMAAQLARIIQV